MTWLRKVLASFQRNPKGVDGRAHGRFYEIAITRRWRKPARVWRQADRIERRSRFTDPEINEANWPQDETPRSFATLRGADSKDLVVSLNRNDSEIRDVYIRVRPHTVKLVC